MLETSDLTTRPDRRGAIPAGSAATALDHIVFKRCGCRCKRLTLAAIQPLGRVDISEVDKSMSAPVSLTYTGLGSLQIWSTASRQEVLWTQLVITWPVSHTAAKKS
jgi:hypothetical protein